MAYNNNPIVQHRIFLARQKKAHEIGNASRIGFIRGVKAAAKAAKQLIDEGVKDSPEFESLVFQRVTQRRCSDGE